jgi:hypothetical protein
MGNGRAAETYRADQLGAKVTAHRAALAGRATGAGTEEAASGIRLAFRCVMTPRKTLLLIVLVVGLGATMVVSMFSALVALVPLAVAFVPALLLIGRARRLRQASQGRDADEAEQPLEGNDWWRREAARRHITDNRVV